MLRSRQMCQMMKATPWQPVPLVRAARQFHCLPPVLSLAQLPPQPRGREPADQPTRPPTAAAAPEPEVKEGKAPQGKEAPHEAHEEKKGWRAFVAAHGLPCFVYYVAVSETSVLLIFAALQLGWLGGADVMTALHWIGAERWLDLTALERPLTSVFGYQLSAHTGANFVVATLANGVLTPVQLPFCLATYPKLRRWWANRKAALHISETGSKGPT
eukprot:TRINITY_DN6247_c0_g1_i1.p1 TRINITY_DN6247_c0_g1~~TRINITY_DN6247_c0_g1_i1.p1  ORF type:complete len:215 (+),score=33.16 TRINITY_DN6247_c0_g1_i1:546-1190(+)